jgi:hypothetical protein
MARLGSCSGEAGEAEAELGRGSAGCAPGPEGRPMASGLPLGGEVKRDHLFHAFLGAAVGAQSL